MCKTGHVLPPIQSTILLAFSVTTYTIISMISHSLVTLVSSVARFSAVWSVSTKGASRTAKLSSQTLEMKWHVTVM